MEGAAAAAAEAAAGPEAGQPPADEGGAGEARGLAGGGLADLAAAQARGFAFGGAAAEGAPSPAPPPGSPRVSARTLALLIWSLARLGRRPPRGWLLAFKATAEAQMGPEAARRLARFIAGALLAGSGPGDRGADGAVPRPQAGGTRAFAGSQL
jgi:hypothetical protein